MDVTVRFDDPDSPNDVNRPVEGPAAPDVADTAHGHRRHVVGGAKREGTKPSRTSARKRIVELEAELAAAADATLQQEQRLIALETELAVREAAIAEAAKSFAAALAQRDAELARERRRARGVRSELQDEKRRSEWLARELKYSKQECQNMEASQRDLKERLRVARARSAKLAFSLQERLGELAQLEREYSKVFEILGQLSDGIEAIAASRRWRIGDAFGSLTDGLLLRDIPSVMARMRELVAEFRALRASRVSRTAEDQQAELQAAPRQPQPVRSDDLLAGFVGVPRLEDQPSNEGGISIDAVPLIVHAAGIDDADALRVDLVALAQGVPRSELHVVVLAAGVDRTTLGAARLNRILVLSASLRRFDPQFGELGVAPWRVNRVGPSEFLLSFPAVSRCPFGPEDVRAGVGKALDAARAVPSLQALAEALRHGEEEAFLLRTERGLHALVLQMCESERGYRRQVGSLTGVLNYSPRLLELVPSLIASAKAELESVRTAKSLDPAAALRRADTYLYLAIDLSRKDVERHLAPSLDEVLEDVLAAGAAWPLICRALRESFLKGLRLIELRPELQLLIDATDTDDAVGFDIIRHATGFSQETVELDSIEADRFIRRVLSFSKSALVSLARDLRRVVPRLHAGHGDRSGMLIGAIEAELQKDQPGAADRETWMARCLLFLHSPAAGPEFVRWLHDNHTRLGLGFLDRDVIAAVVGDDQPYVRVVNRRFAEAEIDTTVIAPAEHQNVRAYMSATLAHWHDLETRRGRARQRAPSTSSPTVSVIVTTFKPDLQLLALSLLSVIRQSYPSLEIIVVDDCSPPDIGVMIESCVQTVREESPHSIVYLRNDVNLGQYCSRNNAMAVARGQFIAIQDDDDLSHPERIRLQLEPMFQSEGVVATHAYHLRVSEQSRLMVDGDGIGELEGDAPVSFIWRREVFDTLGSFLPSRTRGDIEFRARVRRRYSEQAIAIVRQPLVLMRGGMGTVSSSQEYMYRSAVRALRYMVDHIDACDDALGKRWVPANLR